MSTPPEFDSREQLLEHFRRKYPLGTPFEVIAGAEACEKAGGHLTLSLPAPGHVATRHYVDQDGNPGSMGVQQEWIVEFHFDGDLGLCRLEVEMVSAPRGR